MSLKSKKGSRTSNPPAKGVAKGVAKARPWPYLPQQLSPLDLQTINSNAKHYCIWRHHQVVVATPRKCNPTCKSQWHQLFENVEQLERHKKPHIKPYFSITFNEGYYCRWYRRHPPAHCSYAHEYLVGCSHGVVVAKGIKPLTYFLWAPERRMERSLPAWDGNIPFKFAALSSDMRVFSNNLVVMVLTGITSPALVFHRYSKQWEQGICEWVRQDNTLIDSYSSNKSIMQFTNAIGFRGKFYVLSLKGTLAVIEDQNESQLTITALSKHRAVPSVSCKHFREFLVESCGEILLLFLISKATYNVVDHVEVFGLHVPNLSWSKMGRLADDRTLFAGDNCCMSVNASKARCRKNCIYFTQISGEGWWVYNMDANCIIPPGLSNDNLAWDAESIEE